MANARMIHRDFFTSADLMDLPWFGLVLWAGMIVFADDAGIIRGDPRYLRNLILPPSRARRRPSLRALQAVLERISSAGCAHLCKLEGVSCYKITNFTRFQRLKGREGKRREEKSIEGPAQREPEAESSAARMEAHYDTASRSIRLWLRKHGVTREETVQEVLATGLSLEDTPAWESFRSQRGEAKFLSMLKGHKNPSTVPPEVQPASAAEQRKASVRSLDFSHLLVKGGRNGLDR